jgi:hypothetical protein
MLKIANPEVVSPSSAAPAAASAQEALRAAMVRQLWAAALMGDAQAGQEPARASGFVSAPGLPSELLAVLSQLQGLDDGATPPLSRMPMGPVELGSNAIYEDAIQSAAQRTGLEPGALAAIIEAEAAKLPGGQWDPYSRNPRSSAAGLSQFLSGTWITEAQRPGTFLNQEAARRGWLDQEGRVLPQARETLLNLRFEPTFSIHAAADYARDNLARLDRLGFVEDNASPERVAQLAYLTHHLGPQGAVDFLRGAFTEDRAKHLLSRQIGDARAAAYADRNGGYVSGHRAWLNGYIDRKIDL